MNKPTPLMTPQVATELMGRLQSLPSAQAEAGTLAHCFTDLEESFRAMLDNWLPKLVDQAVTGEQLNSLLLDIGEELRHILYHIKDAKFYDYLEP